MKRILITIAAALMVLMAGGAYANDTVTLDVSVNIANTCTTITNGTAATVALNPMTHPDIVNQGITVAPTINCTNGSSHAVSCTSSTGYVLTIGNDGATDPIAYSINGCASPITGQGFTTATSIPFGIDIAGADYQDAQAGVHTDTVTITVTY